MNMVSTLRIASEKLLFSFSQWHPATLVAMKQTHLIKKGEKCNLHNLFIGKA